MQVVMNKCFLLNPEKKIGADPSWENAKNAHINSKKWCHRVEGSATL